MPNQPPRPRQKLHNESWEDYEAYKDQLVFDYEASEEARIKRLIKLGTVGALAFLALIIGLITYSVSTDTVPQDSVGVVVGGGGPINLEPSNKKVKGDAVESPGRIVHGTYDKVWTFPNAQTIRFQDYEVAVTTRDGKTVVINGQLGFRFGAKQLGNKWVENSQAVMQFAKGVGARQYGSERVRPGESIDGFKTFLDVMVVPEILATAKQQIGNVYCADFEPACRVIDPRENVPTTDPDAVYEPMAKAIEQRVAKKLGGLYLSDFRLVVKSIQLTEDVQGNIEALASEQAKTKAAEQAEVTAKAEARAIRTKAQALKQNRSLVGVEMVKACGDGCSVIIDGTGKGAAVVAK